MNFLSAVKHGAIGYGIRRRAWAPEAILHLDNLCELRWLPCPRIGRKESDEPCRILGPDRSSDLQLCDLTAQDWEVI